MLAINGGKPIIKDRNEAKFNWPVVDKEVEDAVLKQLHKTTSIYDRSGVIKEFEDDFKNYHDVEFGLLTNSGTNALYSIFVGADLKEGDEVICPVYTFFATISPIFFTGATPVLCEAQADGNIDPKKIEELITPKTKAVMITHMWGIPCDMDKLVGICKKYDLKLFEDCSHAHGATYKGKLLGTFGDAAAWSLQGPKIITGGEGGIMLTKDRDIYYRALLLGHYHKRCRQEIPDDYSLRKYATTGMGLKLRSHPLAVAMMQVYFSRIDKIHLGKKHTADKFNEAFGKLKGLRIPLMAEGSSPSWYGYVIQYVPEELGELSIEKFVEALHAEGLIEVDLPDSTGPLNELPLFQDPSDLFPSYRGKLSYKSEDFPVAKKFYKNAIKLPVWFTEEDSVVVDNYIKGFEKVIKEHKSLL